MRTLILALALLAASLSADSLALPKLRILAEGGLAETARPFLRELAQTMPEFQMVLASDPDALDAKPLLTLSPRRLDGAAAEPFALKGAVIAVNAKNSFRDISSKDVMKLMKNAYSEWEGTGVPVRNIIHVSGALKVKGGPRKAKTHFIETGSSGAALELLRRDVTAAAILPLTFLAREEAIPPEIRLLAVDGTAPDFESVMNGKYPLAKRYSLSLDPAAPEAVQKLAVQLGKLGFRELEPYGFIPLRKDGK